MIPIKVDLTNNEQKIYDECFTKIRNISGYLHTSDPKSITSLLRKGGRSAGLSRAWFADVKERKNLINCSRQLIPLLVVVALMAMPKLFALLLLVASNTFFLVSLLVNIQTSDIPVILVILDLFGLELLQIRTINIAKAKGRVLHHGGYLPYRIVFMVL